MSNRMPLLRHSAFLARKATKGVLAGAGLLLALGLWAAQPFAALAQGGPGSILPGTRLSFVFAVYAITWVAFFAYALFMARKQQELRRDVEALRKALEERERREGGGGSTPPPVRQR
ncbi:MAG: CcmD family protein [Chloroflexi bacterium]|nr:CcmD family protein [Chloroflexota bacterium]